MDIAGDPDVGYTQTHQVVLNVGYSKAPEVAKRLEDNNIIVNYQAGPEEEGFTASGYLRMGVAEMTRFGMELEEFHQLGLLIREVSIEQKIVRDSRSQIPIYRHDVLFF